MVESLSYSIRALGLSVLMGSGLLAGAPAPVEAQDDGLAAYCGELAGAPASECHLAAAAVRLIHPRVGVALWGGSPVPGSASTLGMRLGSFPRFSMSGRMTLVPMELPPLPDRTLDEGSRALGASISGQTTVGLLTGWSPLPTVGGVFSVDGIVRGSWLVLPDDEGFEDGSVLGVSAGIRIGALRESFTLPGISVTGSYGLSTEVGFGDPVVDDGYIRSGIGNWNLTGAITKRIGPVGVTAGAALDRYTADVELAFPGAPEAGRVVESSTDRWSAFGNVSWTLLILHASLELGWQDAPMPEGIPAAVELEPAGWWAGLAVRMSI